ncbi:type VII secretion-associated serine protease mycosin [Mycobacterium shimoidei]|uniref:type VII secretion-associated serine protease mycosin n=1 Tax=Mycobacterium shimoidei TaxID=29313 RepID=UPI0008483B56|nr:type VII secretion-associated serine protease mycosin [Mycobacterium shimoidei]MCV7257578.1 type VII secretion-associated serine protease mycosin [Mycobacterium shimoidei]ODR13505.1 type VII secretion-associated serine protease mycosin [Mycobacterium shimoidei]ORW81654.1 type VII secretion-associated serine protease mycosin [Mycobacterium shimoidei]
MIRAGLACVAAVLTAATWVCPPAAAISPPVVDPAVPPPNGAPGPVQPMEQRGECTVSGVMPGTDPGAITANQQMMNLPAVWKISRGDGQLVAVIDTGVRPGPRLPNVDPGGDYIETSDGLTDCDGHGTLVAGIIAGQPGDDGFAGVAPGARLLSLRAASAKFSPKMAGGDSTLAQVSFDVAAMARAIVRAADLGARVIDISSVTCLPADRSVDQTALGAAIRYAAVDKDAVIVAASGNSGPTGSAGGIACESNPLTDLSRPNDPRNWAGVTSVSIPSWWQPYVLSAAALTPDGQPAKFSMAGPWVGVAAPGQNIVSVSNRDDGGLANGLPNERQQLVPLSGTSYAAGYVAGVAALVRSKYPDLTAQQVIHRITATAHNGARAPSNLVGAGTVDAMAALTWELPAAAKPDTAPVKHIPAPPEPAPKNYTPLIVAVGGSAALALVVVAAAAIAARRRKELTS